MYFFIKEEYGNNSKIQIIVSQVEADIMIGSLIRKLTKEKGVTKDNLTIISSDCDMYVIGYGYRI